MFASRASHILQRREAFVLGSKTKNIQIQPLLWMNANVLAANSGGKDTYKILVESNQPRFPVVIKD